MPKRDIAPVGAPCWVDLFTSDPERSRAFYGELFGWTSEANPEFGGYITFSHDGIPVAGGMGNDAASGAADAWSLYLASADAAATVAAAVDRGSNVTVPPMPVGELGTMAVVTDPGGASIGIWQPGLHKGFGIYAESNAPAWFELHSNAYDASVQFYRDVFGWDAQVMSDVPQFRYTTLGEGEGRLAGIMDASAFLAGQPSHWAVYFGVDDTDKALAQIGALGGRTVQPAEDTPYGRLAEATDPTGTRFKLVANMQL